MTADDAPGVTAGPGAAGAGAAEVGAAHPGATDLGTAVPRTAGRGMAGAGGAGPGGRGPERLRRRADFLRVAEGGRVATAGFLLQGRARPEAPGAAPRVGFTCSRKLGNAVVRNRAKRRLRALAGAVLAGAAWPGWA